MIKPVSLIVGFVVLASTLSIGINIRDLNIEELFCKSIVLRRLKTSLIEEPFHYDFTVHEGAKSQSIKIDFDGVKTKIIYHESGVILEGEETTTEMTLVGSHFYEKQLGNKINSRPLPNAKFFVVTDELLRTMEEEGIPTQFSQINSQVYKEANYGYVFISIE